MRKIILFILMHAVASLNFVFSQSCPPNIDFETGSFANWECFVGNTVVSGGQNQINLVPSAPVPGRHEIISGASLRDQYGNFPQVCPYGGKYSVKLGNNRSSSEAEAISYTFRIPPVDDTFSFTYFYAVVFEDPSHLVIEQPRFFVTAYDVATGQLINCASYDYVATGSIPGFQMSPINNGVLYKDWSPVSIQFAGLANHTVRLEFRTADCTKGGHFGYAYLDVSTGCSNILATAPYCVETNSVILNAPYGFQSYTWYNQDYSAIVGNQQSITLSPPPATSGIFHVDIVPFVGYGCRDTVNAIVTPLPVPDTPTASDYVFCQFQPATRLSAVRLPGCDLFWYNSATGGVGSNIGPIPATGTAGTFYYYVTQKVLFGCESLRKKVTVTVTPTPVVSFTINNSRQCNEGNNFVFTSTSTNLQNEIYRWDFGDGQYKDSAGSAIAHSYAAPGVYQVRLLVLNPPVCTAEKILTVTVLPKPIADFKVPSLVCEGTPIIISNNSSTPGGGGVINGWWWNINGNVSLQQTPTPVANQPAQYPIKLMVTTTDGCRSDTTTQTITVKYRPVASFTMSSLLCENEKIAFTNTSSLPAIAAPEYISKWYWQYDNNLASTNEHQSGFFTPGVHLVSLVAESDYGCKSVAAIKSIVVQQKPHIQLNITDSCVFRAIRFEASEPGNNSLKWLWDFGSGFKNAPAAIHKNYSKEGNFILTLMGENSYGCKDTLTRAFRIYDNKAFAGRDTIVAMNQPVQLNANGDGSTHYQWTPSLGLNDPAIRNPIATLDRDQLYRLASVTDQGCESHSQVLIKRYKGPELYIPSAFTPNGDGTNDVLKVFPAGIRSFDYMAVYNRFGQQLFITKDYTKGWDGTFKGVKQDMGTYVVIARAIDYTGKVMARKGSVILIR